MNQIANKSFREVLGTMIYQNDVTTHKKLRLYLFLSLEDTFMGLFGHFET